MTEQIKNLAPRILEIINNAGNILLHCHPYPDPDSVGSVLAMTVALEAMGKKVVPIAGDSDPSQALYVLPGIERIQKKSYGEIDPTDFDLFIILDSSTPSQITQATEISFPETLKTVVIDHHKTNTLFGDINLVETTYASTSQIVYELFAEWGVTITKEMALWLFAGLYFDTGGFVYINSSPDSFLVAHALTEINPNYHKVIFEIRNNKSPLEIEMTGLAYSSVKTHLSGTVAFSAIPYEEIAKRNLSRSEAMEGLVGSSLRAVKQWKIVASMVEAEPNVVTVSLRTRDESKYDMSKIAKNVGEKGGGHGGAAGTIVHGSLAEASDMLLREIVKQLA